MKQLLLLVLLMGSFVCLYSKDVHGAFETVKALEAKGEEFFFHRATTKIVPRYVSSEALPALFHVQEIFFPQRHSKSYLVNDRILLAETNSAVVKETSAPYIIEPTTGSLKVISLPTGADISINGNHTGQTPAQFSNVQPGTFRVSVSKEGYLIQEQHTEIYAGNSLELSFDLEKKETKGWLTVHVTPQNARVRILNIRPVYRPNMDLKAGAYHIEASAVGFTTKKRWVKLAAGDDLKVTMTLKQNRESSDQVK